jgi:hypothetical protein
LAEKEWLMLNFTLPKEPSRVRVSVWRKLKKYGSVSIGQSMWLLPLSDKHIGIFNEISNEIMQNNGNAYIVKADFIDTVSSTDVINLFNKARDEEYEEFLDKCEDFFREIEKETAKENFSYGELEENEEEYNKLAEWLKKIITRDFFNAPQKNTSEQYLEKCQQLLDGFSDRVYKSNEDK